MNNFALLSALLLAINLAIAIALFAVAPRRREHQTFALLGVGACGWSLVWFLWYSGRLPPDVNTPAVGLLSGLALLATALAWLAVALRAKRPVSRPRGPARAALAAALGASLLGANDLLLALGVPVYPFTRIPPTPLGALAPLLYVALFVHGFVRDRWIELRIAIGRSLEAVFRTAFLFSVCALSMLVVHAWIPGAIDLSGLLTGLAVLLLGQILAELVFPRFLWRAADRLRRKIHGRRFDYLEGLRSLANLPGRGADTTGELEAVCRHLRDTFRLGLVEIWLRDASGRPRVIPARPGLTEANLPSRWDDVVRESAAAGARDDLWVIPLKSVGAEPLGYIRLLSDRPSLRLNEFERQAILGLAAGLSRRIEEEAVRASLDLREVNEAKDRFLASINHELRNPLNGITGLIHLLRKEGLRGRSSYLVETMQACADQLVATIDNALDFASLTHGSPVARPERFELGALVRGSTAHHVVGSGDRIALHLPPDACWLIGDAGKLRQIISNYVGNALKYGQPPQAEVHAFVLNVTPGGAQLRIEVSSPSVDDTGEDPAEYFKPMRRGRRAVETGVSGAGLGLAICQRLAESMGGAVGARREGGALLFWVRVPVSTASAPYSEKTAPPVLASRPLRVFAIEDEAYNRLVLNHHLVSWGFDVEWAGDAAEAVAKIGDYRPDVVIMDWLLGHTDGAALIPKLHAAQAGEPAPVVVLSAYSTDEKQNQAIAAGACRFLSKPLQPEALLEAIRKAVAPLSEAARIAAPLASPPQAHGGEPSFDIVEAEQALRAEWAGVLATWRADPRAAVNHTHRMRGVVRLLTIPDLSRLLAKLEVALSEPLDASVIADTIRAVAEFLDRRPSPPLPAQPPDNS